MAHTYVIQSVTSVGDVTTVVGTVDGTPVTCTVWLSALAKFPTAVQAQSFIASAMLAALPPQATPQPTYQGTVSQ